MRILKNPPVVDPHHQIYLQSIWCFVWQEKLGATSHNVAKGNLALIWEIQGLTHNSVESWVPSDHIIGHFEVPDVTDTFFVTRNLEIYFGNAPRKENGDFEVRQICEVASSAQHLRNEWSWWGCICDSYSKRPHCFGVLEMLCGCREIPWRSQDVV